MFILFVLKPLKEKKKYLKFLNYFNAKFFMPLGTIQFSYNKAIFNISRIARGAGISTNVGGSFPVLWSYVESCPKIILGNAESSKYTTGNFLRLPPHKVVSISGFDFLIGSQNEEILDKIKQVLNSEPELAIATSKLFQKNFAHLCIAHEFHILNFLIKRKNVLRYICLSEDVYENPAMLEEQLKTISDLLLKLKIHFEA